MDAQDKIPMAVKYSIVEAGRRLGSEDSPVGRTTVYRLIRDGELGSLSIGGKRYVSEQHIREYEARLHVECARLAG